MYNLARNTCLFSESFLVFLFFFIKEHNFAWYQRVDIDFFCCRYYVANVSVQ